MSSKIFRQSFQQALRSTSALTLVAATLLAPNLAYADDHVISTAETTQNGGLTINSNDTITVTSTGSIIRSGNSNPALNLVSITGVTGYNYGTLETSGSVTAFDIYDDNTGTNYGTITGSGAGNTGMSVSYDSTMTNAGTIISSATGSTINSEAGMRFWGARSNGVNSGTITMTGAGAVGAHLVSRDDNTFTNSGTINVSGTGGIGIFLHNDGGPTSWSSNNIINNTGTIIASGGATTAISMGKGDFGHANTLNLLPGSQITGIIDLGGDNVATILNITPDAARSVLWDLSTGTMAGGAPTVASGGFGVYDATTKQYASIDTSAFSSGSDGLASITGLISGVTQNRLSGGSTSSSALGYAAASSSSTIIEETFAQVETVNQGWGQIVGNYAEYDATGSTLASSQKQLALIAGYDWSLSVDTVFGIIAGYTQGNLTSTSKAITSIDNDTKGAFAGLYGRTSFDHAFASFGLTAGASSHTDDRYVNDNLKAGGVAHALGDYDSKWISPEVSFGIEYDLTENWTSTPSIRLAYAGQWMDGYTETGTSANATIGDRHIGVAELSLEWAATHKTATSTLTGRIGYAYRKSVGDSTTDVTLLSVTKSVANNGADRHVGYLGGEALFALNDTLDLEFAGQVEFSEDHTGGTGSVKLISKF